MRLLYVLTNCDMIAAGETTACECQCRVVVLLGSTSKCMHFSIHEALS
jgi:hypothetical protein